MRQFISSLQLPRILERDMAEYLIRCIRHQSKYSEEISKVASKKYNELFKFLKF